MQTSGIVTLVFTPVPDFCAVDAWYAAKAADGLSPSDYALAAENADIDDLIETKLGLRDLEDPMEYSGAAAENVEEAVQGDLPEDDVSDEVGFKIPLLITPYLWQGLWANSIHCSCSLHNRRDNGLRMLGISIVDAVRLIL